MTHEDAQIVRLDRYEALDRLSVHLDQLDRFYDYPGLCKKANKKVNDALESLAEAYQLQGASFEWHQVKSK